MEKKTFSTLTKSHESTEYQTPRDLFDKLNSIFEFKLDPCTTKDNPLGIKHFYYKTDIPDDGMSGPWNYNTYINPPFGNNIKNWILKMNDEARVYSNNQYVMLLPARTETKWFQELIYDRCHENSIIYFLKGRLKFVNPILNSKSQPHIIGSMLWIKNASSKQIKLLNELIPGIVISRDNKIYESELRSLLDKIIKSYNSKPYSKKNFNKYTYQEIELLEYILDNKNEEKYN